MFFDHPPQIKPDDGCVAVELPMFIASGRSLSSGLLGGEDRMRIRLYKRIADGHTLGKVWFGDGAEGPPENVHGGAVAYVLDEAMGSVGWMNDYPIVAKKIDFEFLRMSPLKVDFTIEAKIVRTTEKRVYVESELRLPTGEVCVKGQGEFAILSRRKMEALNAEKFDPKGLFKNPKLKWAADDPR
jgi:acyl-coenzyme A thioesterase PaaI-like protein